MAPSTRNNRNNNFPPSSVQVRLSNSLSSPRVKSSSSLSQRSHGSASTSKQTIHSSSHGRLRRGQRRISKYQLQKALKHGTATRIRPGVTRYKYQGITFIYNEQTRKEITSYVDALDIPYRTISKHDQQKHKQACHELRQHPEKITSHSVLLVDTSGSMRQADVQGARSRLSAVFLAIAQDFLQQRIEAGLAGYTDAISVIRMGETPEVVFSHLPSDWVTFNKLLKLYKEGPMAAAGHCAYLPALGVARELLLPHQTIAHCDLCLVLFSDGRPSDAKLARLSWDGATKLICSSIESMASLLGNRFSVHTIGMGSSDQFVTLNELCETAKSFGSHGMLLLPSMSASGLGKAVSSIATSLASHPSNARIRAVQRENNKELPLLTEAVTSDLFDIYPITRVIRQEYKGKEFHVAALLHPDARHVAIRKNPFGEGTERFAYQFFEVAADGTTVIGDALVAKESRFENSESEAFGRHFCRLQHHAQTIAHLFNKKMDSMPKLDPQTARVDFLPCSLYKLHQDDGSVRCVIIEPRLFGKFQKWNSNNGWTRSGPVTPESRPPRASLMPIKEEDSEDEAMEVPDFDDMLIKSDPDTAEPVPSAVLSDASINNNMVVDLTHDTDRNVDQIIDLLGNDEYVCVTRDEVAQAFSHFSYVMGGRKLLLCDLQGVANGNLLRFTDPVIHSFETNGRYGKTDRGDKGIQDFLNNHECNALCHLVTRGFMTVHQH